MKKDVPYRLPRLARNIAASAALLFTFAPAADAVDWSAPTALSDQKVVFSPFQRHTAISMHDTGDAVAVWSQADVYSTNVFAAIQRVGEPWTAPTQLSSSGADGIDPSVTFSADGTVTAIWRERADGASSTQYVVRVASLAAGASVWGSPVTISDLGPGVSSQQIASDSAGNDVAVWQQLTDSGDSVIQSARFAPGAGWSAPVALSSPTGFAYFPDLSVNAAGAAVAVWIASHQSMNADPFAVQAASMLASGEWDAAIDIATKPAGGGVFGPQVAMDGAGVATAVWALTLPGALYPSVIQTADMPWPGDWTAPEDLSSPEFDTRSPGVAVDVAGNVTAVWEAYLLEPPIHPAAHAIQSVMRPAPGTWGQVEQISGGTTPRVAASPDGSLVAAGWLGGGVNVASYSLSSGWSPAQNLGSGDAPSLSAGPGATARAVWNGMVSGLRHGYEVRASALGIADVGQPPDPDPNPNPDPNPPPDPDPNPDNDADGYTADSDCNDNDPGVNPGAVEVKHDGIDQDCNAHDLTVDIILAKYKTEKQQLTVRATSARGPQANLSVTIDMSNGRSVTQTLAWNSKKIRWQTVVKKFEDTHGATPVSIKVFGAEGPETATVKG